MRSLHFPLIRLVGGGTRPKKVGALGLIHKPKPPHPMRLISHGSRPVRGSLASPLLCRLVKLVREWVQIWPIRRAHNVLGNVRHSHSAKLGMGFSNLFGKPDRSNRETFPDYFIAHTCAVLLITHQENLFKSLPPPLPPMIPVVAVEEGLSAPPCP